MRFTTIASGLAVAAGVASAHPGHDVTQELLERREFLTKVERTDLSHCTEKLRARGIEQRNVERRAAALEKARAARGLKKRDFDEVLATDHNKTEMGYTPETDPAILFAGNASCFLSPEETQGPYYVGGEYIRQDMAEDQGGVPLHLDYQVIDMETCEPMSGIYLELWHCNATGVYSGVVASGNGDGAEDNINATFNRGIQPTDEDGVAVFDTIFPGHYTGRATHIHVLTHLNPTVYPNGTLGNEVNATHVGQTFFDQTLISEVELESPYSTNTQQLTENADDSIMADEASQDHDPVHEYVYLGETVADGIFGWIAFGVNTSAVTEVTPAAFLYEGGGVTNPNSGGGGPGGPGGPPSA